MPQILRNCPCQEELLLIFISFFCVILPLVFAFPKSCSECVGEKVRADGCFCRVGVGGERRSSVMDGWMDRKEEWS